MGDGVGGTGCEDGGDGVGCEDGGDGGGGVGGEGGEKVSSSYWITHHISALPYGSTP